MQDKQLLFLRLHELLQTSCLVLFQYLVIDTAQEFSDGRLAPRCRLITPWGRSDSQGYGCSPFEVVRQLGLERRETVRSLSAVGAGDLRRVAPSTRGPERTTLFSFN